MTPAPSSPPIATSGGRLLALDVMRGMTILAMILVNNPGSWGDLYPLVAHAEWHGWTPTDLIFPFFLFMVGVAMAYSFRKYTTEEGNLTRAVWLRIARRVVVLLLLGLLLNSSGKIFNVLLGPSETWDFDTLRWPGVLQRIGLAYGIASVTVLWLGLRWQWVLGIGLLAGYWALLALLPGDVPQADRLKPESNIVRTVDLAVIGRPHMWVHADTEPEGLLSTLPSVVSVLIGSWVGVALRGRPMSPATCLQLLFIGLLVAVAGIGLSRLEQPGLEMPINKALWTPTFVLLTGGLGMVAIAICLLLFDVVGKGSVVMKRIAAAFQMVGVNAIFVFVASGVVATLLSILKVGEMSLKGWLHQTLCVSPLNAIGLTDPRLASLAFAIGFVACWWLVLWAMWRRGWSVRV